MASPATHSGDRLDAAAVPPFIPARVLQQRYAVFGHFYSVELASNKVVECRSVLEIAHHDHTPKVSARLSASRPDAVFIMMNPGSSKPLVEVNNRVHASAIHKLPISLVPTRPDTTQYQVMRLMHLRRWRHVRVLNLSDLRSPKSAEFIRLFRRLEHEESFDSHSIFSAARADELSRKLPRSSQVALVLAWGVSDQLAPLIERCLPRLPRRCQVVGLLEPGSTSKYRHPLPSLQRDQRRWIAQILRQFDR